MLQYFEFSQNCVWYYLFCLFITLEIKNEFERTALWDIVFHTEYCFSILHILAKIVGHLVISIQKICILCNVVQCVILLKHDLIIYYYYAHLIMSSCLLEIFPLFCFTFLSKFYRKVFENFDAYKIYVCNMAI